MDANNLTPEEKVFLVKGLRDPVVREALELLAPMNQDAQTALRVAVPRKRDRQQAGRAARGRQPARGA